MRKTSGDEEQCVLNHLSHSPRSDGFCWLVGDSTAFGDDREVRHACWYSTLFRGIFMFFRKSVRLSSTSVVLATKAASSLVRNLRTFKSKRTGIRGLIKVEPE